MQHAFSLQSERNVGHRENADAGVKWAGSSFNLLEPLSHGVTSGKCLNLQFLSK